MKRSPDERHTQMPMNSFCPLDRYLVLTSDDFHYIFSPSPPPSCLTFPLVALFQNSHVVPSLLCIYIHLLSSDQKRHL